MLKNEETEGYVTEERRRRIRKRKCFVVQKAFKNHEPQRIETFSMCQPKNNKQEREDIAKTTICPEYKQLRYKPFNGGNNKILQCDEGYVNADLKSAILV